MASYDDWWGFLIFVFFILAIAVFVIKILIEYPGLMEFKLVYSDSIENLIEETEHDDIEQNHISGEVSKERDKEHILVEKQPNHKLRTKNSARPRNETVLMKNANIADNNCTSDQPLQNSGDKHSLLVNI